MSTRLAEEIADALAQEALRVAEETGDERLTDELYQTIGALSPTIEEALRTAIRMRMAEKRGYELLRQKRRQSAP
ncbi:hypothetical protein OE810_11545 [Rhodobacteraceae bacterium XHP0102]|nr:hypothetical protein [Rhodobacteraceae bacterium XHP0102]